MPSLLERRGSRGVLSLRTLDDSNLSSVVSPVVTKRNIRGPPTVSGFAPLPPITASPVCTPTASIATASSLTGRIALSSPPLETRTSSSSQTTSSYLTPPTTPSDHSTQLPVPTWAAMPPIPSTQLLFRSLTSTSRKSRSLIPPSASSPVARFSHNARPLFKRRASCPDYNTLDPAVSAPQTDCPPPQLMAPAAVTSASKASKPRLFHVADDEGSDAEDLAISYTTSPGLEDAYIYLEFSEQHNTVIRKDRIRRFHALLELLTTEMAYLSDLRTLVKVYLRTLSTWTCKGSGAFTRTSSFTSSSRVNSASHLHPTNITPLTPIDTKLSPARDKRFMFSSADMDVLSRNVEDVLDLHERFVDELHALMAALDFPIPSNDSEAEQFRQDPDPWLSKVDDATRAVSSKFATEASRFNSYQIFCVGHSEALTLVHKAQHQYTADWSAFQQFCSAEMLAGDESSESPGMQVSDAVVPDHSMGGSRSRTISTSSTDSVVNIIRRNRTRTTSSDPTPELSVKAKNSRLNFVDYLIKPVQRICKYPLLLDQLRSRGIEDKLADDLNVIVQSATQAMRHVASSVDEARHQQDVAIQSSLIALRMSAALSLANAYYSSSSHQQIDVLTPSFLSSLGTCLLAGPLDVLHSKGTTVPKTAKYLAIFLYAGYIVLAKVKSKSHYEPRHWFPLSLMTITDVNSEAIFPHSFRLAHQHHQFEFAASCQGEKAVWLSALRKSMPANSTWINEPTPSLYLVNKGDTVTKYSEPPSSWHMDSTWAEPLPFTLEDVRKRPAVSEDGYLSSHATQATKSKPSIRTLSRRSSTTSIKARFSSANSPSASPTMTISRFSSAARYAVDNALQDIISESCSTARVHATNREEDLFPVSGLTRSRTASVAINRLSRHESVRVPRRQSFVEALEPPALRPIQPRPQNSPISQPSSATIMSSDESVPPLTNSSRSGTPSSTMSSPIVGSRFMSQPRRTTRSMVSDLRDLLSPHSPSNRRSSMNDSPKASDTVPKTSSFTLFRKWARTHKHRRTNSAPGQPPYLERTPELHMESIPVLPDLNLGLRLSVSPKKT